jgi:hypothetical protein
MALRVTSRSGAGVPGADDRLQQAERQHRDEQAEHCQSGAQFVPQRVAHDELEKLPHLTLNE